MGLARRANVRAVHARELGRGADCGRGVHGGAARGRGARAGDARPGCSGAGLDGGDHAGFTAAAQRFRDVGMPFWLAMTLLEQGEPAGLAEALEIFERLEATPWLERAAAAASE